jgi:hypothetical protein
LDRRGADHAPSPQPGAAEIVRREETMSDRYVFEIFSLFGFAGALLALWLMGAFA